VDVMEGDIEDSRHQVRRRDDIANLQRMYFHLFRYVLRAQWPDGSVWQLFPDEHTAMDWATVQDFLDFASTEVEIRRDLLTGGKYELRLREEFSIVQIQPVSSANYALIQLADLFAGMCVFSRESYGKYEAWVASQTPMLFQYEDRVSLNASDRERCTVIRAFDDSCKSCKLGVSLRTNRGLRTHDPRNPLNFWWYIPQHPMDKAPTKAQR
jgi:hypothetical protein